MNNIKIELVLPATIVCLLPWLLSGIPINDNWMTAFVICISIDLFVKFNKKKKE